MEMFLGLFVLYMLGRFIWWSGKVFVKTVFFAILGLFGLVALGIITSIFSALGH